MDKPNLITFPGLREDRIIPVPAKVRTNPSEDGFGDNAQMAVEIHGPVCLFPEPIKNGKTGEVRTVVSLGITPADDHDPDEPQTLIIESLDVRDNNDDPITDLELWRGFAASFQGKTIPTRDEQARDFREAMRHARDTLEALKPTVEANKAKKPEDRVYISKRIVNIATKCMMHDLMEAIGSGAIDAKVMIDLSEPEAKPEAEADEPMPSPEA